MPRSAHPPSDRDAPFTDFADREHRENLGRRAIVAVAWNGLQLWGYNLVGLGVFVVLGRLLSPADFGLAAAAMVVIWLLRIVVDAGFSRLLVQRSRLEHVHADTAFWTGAVLGVTFAAITVSAAPLFADLFGQPRLVPFVRALSLIFIFAGLDSTPTALLQRDLKWRALALRRLAATVVSAGVAVVLAVDGAGAWALVAQQLVLEALTASLLWFGTSWRPALRFSRLAFLELLAFGGRYSLLRVFTYLGGNVDNFLIGVALGTVALGYYVIAYRVFVVLNELFVQTISNVALPTFSRLNDDQEALNANFCRASALAGSLAFPAYAGLAIVAGQLVPVVFGAKWHASVPVLELLTLAGAAQAQLAFSSSYVVAIGLINRELPWTIWVTVAELIGFGATVHFGITAVAGALAVVLAVAWPVRLLFLRRRGNLMLGDYFAALRPPVLATAGMSAVILALHLILASLPPLTILIVEVLAGMAVYPVILAVLAPAEFRGLKAGLTRLRRQTAAETP